MPWNMKVDGRLRKRRQEDELNSEKCGVADSLGRLSEMEEGLGDWVERSRGNGNDVENPKL